MVDTLGLLRAVVVTAGNVDDGAVAHQVVGKLYPQGCSHLETLFGDHKYHNHKFEAWLAEHNHGPGVGEL